MLPTDALLPAWRGGASFDLLAIPPVRRIRLVYHMKYLFIHIVASHIIFALDNQSEITFPLGMQNTC